MAQRFAKLVCTTALGVDVVLATAPQWIGGEKMGGTLKQDSSKATWTEFNKAHSAENVIATQFEGVSFKQTGDKVHFKLGWVSDGPSFDSRYWNSSEYQYECARKDVQMKEASSHPQCLAGTGDFRVFVGDSNGKALKKGFSSSDIGSLVGYNFRIFPHASSEARYYKPADGSPRPGSSVVQSSFNIQDSKHKNGPFSDHRLWPASDDEKKNAPGGFDLKLGESSYLLINMERKSDDEVYLYFEMNDSDQRRRYTHQLSSGDVKYLPETVDTIMIDYPNERGYTSLQLSFDGIGSSDWASLV